MKTSRRSRDHRTDPFALLLVAAEMHAREGRHATARAALRRALALVDAGWN